MLIVCKQCGRRLDMRSSEHKHHVGFCSRACRNKYYTRKCDFCGKEYVAPRTGSRFCSPDCNIKAGTLMQKKRREELKFTCVACGREVDKNVKYCSLACIEKEHARLSTFLANLDKGKLLESKIRGIDINEIQVKGFPDGERESGKEIHKTIERVSTKKPAAVVKVKCEKDESCIEDSCTHSSAKKPSKGSTSRSKAKKTESHTNTRDGKNGTRKCDYCGDSFKPKTVAQKFCCEECRLLYWKYKGVPETSTPPKSIEQPKPEFTVYEKRKCHDCGKPTYSYRCDKCWQKHRQKYGGSYSTGGIEEHDEF